MAGRAPRIQSGRFRQPLALTRSEALPFGTRPQADYQIPRYAVNFAPITGGQLRKGAAQQNRRAFVERQVFQIESRFRCGVGHG